MVTLTNRQFALLAVLETALVVAVSIVWFHFRTKAYLSAPGDGDLYAHTEGFQWAVNYFYYLPIIIFFNTLVLAVTHGAIVRNTKRP